MPFGKPVETKAGPSGFGAPVETAVKQEPWSFTADPKEQQNTVSVFNTDTQGDYSRKWQYRNGESFGELKDRLLPSSQPRRDIPMGDITTGYLPSHAAAASTGTYADELRPEPVAPTVKNDTSWDQVKDAMSLSPSQQSAALQAQPAGDFAADGNSPGMMALSVPMGFARTASSGLINTGADDVGESGLAKSVNVAGESAGVLAQLMGLRGMMPGGPMLKSALAFGAQGALAPGTIEDRAVGGMQNFAMGAGFAGLGAASGPVGNIVRSPIAGPAVDFGAMYGLEKAAGADNEDAIRGALAMTAMGRMTHMSGRGDVNKKNSRDPVRQSPEDLRAGLKEVDSVMAEMSRERADALIISERASKAEQYRAEKEAARKARELELQAKADQRERERGGAAPVDASRVVPVEDPLPPRPEAPARGVVNHTLSPEPAPSVFPKLNPTPESLAPQRPKTPWQAAMKQEVDALTKAGDKLRIATTPINRKRLVKDIEELRANVRKNHQGGRMDKILSDFVDGHKSESRLLEDHKALMKDAESAKKEIERIVDEEISNGTIESADRQKMIDGLVAIEMFPELSRGIDGLARGGVDGNTPIEMNLDGIKPGQAQFIDHRRVLQGLSGGHLGVDNLLDTYVWRINEAAHLATNKMSDTFTTRLRSIVDFVPKADRRAFAEIMHVRDQIATAKRSIEAAKGDAKNITPSEAREVERQAMADIAGLQAREQAAWGRVKSRASVERAMSEMRLALDDIHKNLSELRSSYGDKDVGYLEDYWSSLEAKPAWYDVKAKASNAIKTRTVRETPAKDQRVINKFERHRTGAGHNQEMDPYRIVQEYGAAAAKQIGNRIALEHNKNVANLLEFKGESDAANIVRQINESSYVGEPSGIAAQVNRAAYSHPATALAASVIEWHGQQFKRAMFNMNLKWSLLTQGSSTLLAVGKNPEYMLRATQLYLDPAFRSMLRDTYAYKMKSRKHGSITSGLDGDTVMSRGSGKMETANDVLEFLGRFVENQTVYYSGAVSYLRARELQRQGILKSDRDVMNHTSDGIAKTQSMYDKYNKAPILGSRLISAENPAQAFKVELMNFWREMLGNNVGSYKEYQGVSSVRVAAQVLAAMAINTYLMQELFGHKTFTVTSGIPFVGGAVDAAVENSGLAEKFPAIAPFLPDYYGSSGYSESVQNTLVKAGREFARGNEAKAAAQIARLYLPAGAQAARALQTYGAKTGEYKFDLNGPVETIVSGAFGPYATQSGRDSLDGKKRKALPAPTRYSRKSGRNSGARSGR